MTRFYVCIILFILNSCTRTIPWFEKVHTTCYRHEPQKPIAIIIPSYNNHAWYRYNLDSVYAQRYTNFRVIYIDDCSTDNTAYGVQQYLTTNKRTNCTFIKNPKRVGALANIWRAIWLCQDHEIIVTLDGDDWFAHDQVLAYLNHEYQDPALWLTYGQFQNWPTACNGWCEPIPAPVIQHNFFRLYGFYFAQLRTFYAWLAKQINKKDLIDPATGTFYRVAGDVALMFPMIELAGTHSKFINHVLYYHNVETPLNDFKVNQDQQRSTALFLERQQPYQPLVPTHLKNITSSLSFTI